MEVILDRARKDLHEYKAIGPNGDDLRDRSIRLLITNNDEDSWP